MEIKPMGYLEIEGGEKEPIVQQRWVDICEKCKANRQITTQFLLNTDEKRCEKNYVYVRLCFCDGYVARKRNTWLRLCWPRGHHVRL